MSPVRTVKLLATHEAVLIVRIDGLCTEMVNVGGMYPAVPLTTALQDLGITQLVQRVYGLTPDEAIVALSRCVLCEDNLDQVWSVDIPGIKHYCMRDWGRSSPIEHLQQMTSIWRLEQRLIRTTMAAVRDAKYLSRPSERRLLSVPG